MSIVKVISAGAAMSSGVDELAGAERLARILQQSDSFGPRAIEREILESEVARVIEHELQLAAIFGGIGVIGSFPRPSLDPAPAAAGRPATPSI